jgi:hypothetical protein
MDIKPAIFISPAAGVDRQPPSSPYTLTYTDYTGAEYGAYRSPSAVSLASSVGLSQAPYPPSRRNSSQSCGSEWNAYYGQALVTPLPPSPVPPPQPPIGLGVELSGHAGNDTSDAYLAAAAFASP